MALTLVTVLVGYATCGWFSNVLTRYCLTGEPGIGFVIWNGLNVLMFIILAVVGIKNMRDMHR